LVESHSQRRASAGRPRTVYATVGDREPGGYPMLVRMLAAQLAATPEKRAVRAEKAGLAWAATVMPDEDRSRAVDVEEAAQAVTGIFGDLGFDPELAGDGRGHQIRLRACPFRTAARATPRSSARYTGACCGAPSTASAARGPQSGCSRSSSPTSAWRICPRWIELRPDRMRSARAKEGPAPLLLALGATLIGAALP